MGLPPLAPEVLASLHGTTSYWLPDATDVVGEGVCDMARACSVQCATSLVSCKAFEKHGCKAISQVYEGYDPDIWHEWFLPRKHPTWPTEKIPITRDVVFIGNVDDENRKAGIEALRAAGINVETPKAWLSDASKIYAESKVSLNFVRGGGEIASDRAVHIMASGGRMLTQDCADLRHAFSDYWTFTDPANLVSTVKWLLKDDNWKKSEAAWPVNQGGKKHQAHLQYRWTDQMKKLVRALEGERIFDGSYTGGAA